MARETLEKRVDNLDHRVTAVEQLPERVTALESQIVQLRGEMRSEFSAIQEEIREQGQGLRQEMRDLFAQSERHARILHEDVIGRIAALRER
jgi:predicted  nucleic acid-binding Zn-ribbon protein